LVTFSEQNGVFVRTCQGTTDSRLLLIEPGFSTGAATGNGAA
jgi:hypothetical protein